MRESSSFTRGVRSNALWGSGSKGESRKNTLWGSGKRGNAIWGGRNGRGMLSPRSQHSRLVVPLAAGAKGAPGAARTDLHFARAGREGPDRADRRSFTSSFRAPAARVDASIKVVGLGSTLRKRLDVIGAIAVDIPAGKLARSAKQPGLIVTPDASVHYQRHDQHSTQMWPYETGLAKLWGTPLAPAPQAPTIAVVDSGIQAAVPTSTTARACSGTSPCRGSTTNSAGRRPRSRHLCCRYRRGFGGGYAGAAPNAGDPVDRRHGRRGVARTSDVIAACEFILTNKGKYNIRVANFSLHSGCEEPLLLRPARPGGREALVQRHLRGCRRR